MNTLQKDSCQPCSLTGSFQSHSSVGDSRDRDDYFLLGPNNKAQISISPQRCGKAAALQLHVSWGRSQCLSGLMVLTWPPAHEAIWTLKQNKQQLLRQSASSQSECLPGMEAVPGLPCIHSNARQQGRLTGKQPMQLHRAPIHGKPQGLLSLS